MKKQIKQNKKKEVKTSGDVQAQHALGSILKRAKIKKQNHPGNITWK